MVFWDAVTKNETNQVNGLLLVVIIILFEKSSAGESCGTICLIKVFHPMDSRSPIIIAVQLGPTLNRCFIASPHPFPFKLCVDLELCCMLNTRCMTTPTDALEYGYQSIVSLF
ncbi:hypothetical protein RB195_003963 [Necator americanus]|uniref:Uncharacterized protein n=1 Tax=Necator americanus TaxID=51031 RepID=A0ABR1DR39_NECAM